jgi:uncharacterized membrane protein YkvI
MKKLNGWSAGATYIGAIIGAGFASGQELLQFFVQFGAIGGVGVLIAGGLFSLLGAMILRRSSQLQTAAFGDFIIDLFGRKLGKYIILIIISHLLAGLVIMLAGSGSVLAQSFQIPPAAAIVISGTAVAVTCLFGVYGVAKVNTVLMPILACFTLSICGITLHNHPMVLPKPLAVRVGSGFLLNWFVASLLYVGFNSIGGVVVLSSFGREIDQKEGVKGGIIGGAGLGIIALSLSICLWSYYPTVLNYQIPMAYIAGQITPFFEKVFSLVIWIAMYTTAVAFTISFVREASRRIKLGSGFLSLITVAGAIPFAQVGFAHLVGMVYPFYGVISVFVIGYWILQLLLRRFLRQKRDGVRS